MEENLLSEILKEVANFVGIEEIAFNVEGICTLEFQDEFLFIIRMNKELQRLVIIAELPAPAKYSPEVLATALSFNALRIAAPGAWTSLDNNTGILFLSDEFLIANTTPSAFRERLAHKMQDSTLSNRINTASIEKIAVKTYPTASGDDVQKQAWLTPRVKRWAQSISNRIPINFSAKLNDANRDVQDAKTLKFILKNAWPDEFISEQKVSDQTTRKHYNDKNWDGFLSTLDSITECIRALDGTNNFAAAKDKYRSLSPENQNNVDILIKTHFFRQTSKVGLSFARSSGAKILFSWNAPGARDLGQLQRLLQTKIYNDANPNFRESKYHEAITFSEMRELGRLRQNNEAPDYLLISKINGIAV